ncbi:hypothetical protein [Chryseobacterium indoltheticum]|uniref:hypothetical protein n=1 Tax=Chryseobacterium indoltheticum TaxID=254 RepID=UPI003F4981E2
MEAPVALLISSKPDLIEIENNWGVATESVFDFLNQEGIFKKEDLVNASEAFPDKIEILQMNLFSMGNIPTNVIRIGLGELISIMKKFQVKTKPSENWKYLIFHLPYAFSWEKSFYRNLQLRKQSSLFKC